MATIRKTALTFLLVLLSASIFFNSPALAEVVLCLSLDCASDEGHATDDPCESFAESAQEPSLHSHEEGGGCDSCIRLSLLHKAGESIRPTPSPDGTQILPPLVSAFRPDSYPFDLRLSDPSSPRGDPLLAHLRTVRLLI